jgi:3-hydroxybutyryl-CoA dehydrogenase
MEIKCIAIVGAGELGRSLAYASALAGYGTILEDISSSTLEQGIECVKQSLGNQLSLGKISATERDIVFSRISAANSAEDMLPARRT